MTIKQAFDFSFSSYSNPGMNRMLIIPALCYFYVLFFIIAQGSMEQHTTVGKAHQGMEGVCRLLGFFVW